MMTQFVLVPYVTCSDGLSEPKCEMIGFGQKNHHILLSLFHFKLTFQSR